MTHTGTEAAAGTEEPGRAGGAEAADGTNEPHGAGGAEAAAGPGEPEGVAATGPRPDGSAQPEGTDVAGPRSDVTAPAEKAASAGPRPGGTAQPGATAIGAGPVDAAGPAVDPLTPRARRLCDAMSAAFPGPGDAAALRLATTPRDGRRVREVGFVRDGSAGGVPVRVYSADRSPGAPTGPLVVFAHGGGWVMCDPDTHDGLCRELAARAGATVVSVDYRRAPEHRFPAAADDLYAAVVWAYERWGRPVVVAGDSSGGNLAASAALRARDEQRPYICGQLLIYPVLDHRLAGASATEFADGFFHTAAHMRWYWEQYLGPDGDPSVPYASPGLAPDLSGLPPALVVLADCDPLRDEGLAYARGLARTGTPAQVHLSPGMFHGFLGGIGILPEAEAALETASRWLRDGGPPPTAT
ncbi:alpha/beta hydrolase fold domain-containing protein [Streptomyces sp. NPDC004111]|uniref:alpha/beta hydrolase n=1 Tax=Streptomyces sp. NPDC004111 TaxID=3364690 RepID=UPI0036C26562